MSRKNVWDAISRSNSICPDPGAVSPVLENFRPAFSPDPTNCPWVSEDAFWVVLLKYSGTPLKGR